MDKNLAEKLVERKLITETTELTARYRSVSIGGDVNILAQDIFTVERIQKENDNIYFVCTSTRNGEARVLTPSNIVEIDGMDPFRFAAVFDIKADGTTAQVGKRRGRKPKARVVE